MPARNESYDPVSYDAAFARSFQTAATLAKSTDLVITTAEGDKVTLSTSSQETGGYGSYEALAKGKNATAYQSGQSIYYESRQELSFSVTGDLNEQELSDINSIVEAMGGIMDDLVSGDLESAASKGMALTGLSSISQFSATLNVSAGVSVSRETASVGDALPAGKTDGVDQFADMLSGGFKDMMSSTGALAATLDDFFSDWFDRMSSKPDSSPEGLGVAARFARGLMDGLLANNAGNSIDA